jgi:hypothetical protein
MECWKIISNQVDAGVSFLKPSCKEWIDLSGYLGFWGFCKLKSIQFSRIRIKTTEQEALKSITQ